ncbi:hypothetical protein CEXT_387261 [Caerostris extrusa]|uniref:Uncharacterized protein n=1 Tax=Caerostris extrusa TaxID=172846 RepID=A0AAV4RBH8_CAEEX|nr:hypothetical protein CEXT_387261 [Caerostris extrusa]
MGLSLQYVLEGNGQKSPDIKSHSCLASSAHKLDTSAEGFGEYWMETNYVGITGKTPDIKNGIFPGAAWIFGHRRGFN